MSFRAYLSINGKQYDVLDFDLTLNRATDSKGKPSSSVSGGLINVTIESTDDTAIIEMMVNNQYLPVQGSIVILKRDEDAKMKTIFFSKSYIINYFEKLNVLEESAMSIRLTITSEIIKVGNADLSNKWSA